VIEKSGADFDELSNLPTEELRQRRSRWPSSVTT
jgi:hypothetical protein